MSKFRNVPVDEDTRILFQLEAMLGEYEILYQKWYWDGITAESIIFYSEDVSNLDDQAIEEEVRSSPLVNDGSSVTLKRCESGYVFVNFNFITD
jgi:hypothetical protein